MRRRILILALASALAASIVLAACGGGGSNKTASPAAPTATAPLPTARASSTLAAALTLVSDAFVNDGQIPEKYSCSGDSTSPELSWSGAPAGTAEYALIIHDPDAPVSGGFTHWIIIQIPAATTSLPASVPPNPAVGGGGAQIVPYRGMCPPVGASAHHYHFRLYALDTKLAGVTDPTKNAVEAAMQGHILAQTDLVGLFGR